MGAEQSSLEKSFQTVKLILTEPNADENIYDNSASNSFLYLDLRKGQHQGIPHVFTEFESLSLSSNKLETIPANLEQFINLKSLDLSSNYIQQIPLDLNIFSKIEKLNLCRNRLNGINFDCSKFCSLINLDLKSNQLSKVSNLPLNLKELVLDFNQMDQLELKSGSLEKLSMNLCTICQVLPDCYFPNVTEIKLSMNKLQTIPDLSVIFPKLVKIDLSNNLLSKFPKFPISIQQINLSRNLIKEVSIEIKELDQLHELDLSYNDIHVLPEIPRSLVQLNLLNNPIETNISSKCPNISEIQISESLLNKFPSFQLKNLEHLVISSSQIQIISISSLSQKLKSIDLHSNQIKKVPKELFEISSLQKLDLSNNQISELPSSFSSSNISKLNISGNPLHSFPNSFPKSIKQLYASFCELNKIPECFSSLKNLQILIASNNHLITIPSFKSIQVLFLSNNKIAQIKELPSTLQKLDLSFNPLSSLPNVLNFPELVEVDLTHSKVATFPSKMKAPKLLFLRIAHSKIKGVINSDIFPQLQRLDVSGLNVSFENDPRAREIICSSRLFKSNHFTIVSDEKWIGVSETMGLRDTMEDCIVSRVGTKSQISLFGVCDGHGGNRTSVYVARKLASSFLSPNTTFSSQYLSHALESIDKCLQSQNFGDGSTLSAAIIKSRKVIISNVGDSRTMIFDSEGNLSFSTVDHKPVFRDEFERILSENGEVSNGRVFGKTAVSRSFGDFHVHMNAKPDIYEYSLSESDRYLVLCCDGAIDVLSSEQISKCLNENVEIAANSIRNLAISYSSRDNISVIVVDLSSLPVYDEEDDDFQLGDSKMC
jgi:serine/threonine protein phosphatase PrpC/Leucine-rich repeat (LRR) protein